MNTITRLHTSHPIEILESRIAPATFLLSGGAADLHFYKTGTVANVDDTTPAVVAAGATVALAMKAGDMLVFDANGNHKVDAGETVLLKVAGGRAEVFATDFGNGGPGAADGKFENNEITALAVSNGFNATVNGDINGPVLTTLTSTGTFTKGTLQDASIAGLTVNGRVVGDILAGKNISNVKIGVGTIPTALSALDIKTGKAADGMSESYNALGSSAPVAFAFSTEGEAGGNITGVTLAHGAVLIGTGSGNAGVTKNGGAGGSISNITITDTTTGLAVEAGSGGNSAAAKGVGGNGGGISNFKILAMHNTLATDSLSFNAGIGGAGNTGGNGGAVSSVAGHLFNDAQNLLIFAGRAGSASAGTAVGNGGRGGDVKTVAFTADGIVSNTIGIYAGSGNNAGTSGNGSGGAGGVLSGATLLLNKNGNGKLSAVAGVGGDGHGTGVGGKGGAMSNVKITNASVTELYLAGGIGGLGGNSGPGGSGGALTGITLASGAVTGSGSVSLLAGQGGNGGKSGGAGGSVSSSKVTMTGKIGKNLYIYGGTGGVGIGAGPAKGGAGGSLSGLTIQTMDIGGAGNSASILAGNAGSSINAPGAAGGSATGITVNSLGYIGSGTTIGSGAGGGINSGNGSGGNAGNISKITINKKSGAADTFFTQSGVGGDGHGTGNGGNGGNISGVVLNNTVAAFGLYVGNFTGGGNAGATGVKGGNGGNVSSVTINAATVALTNGIYLYGGQGGNASGAGGKGGSGGNVSTVTLDAHNSELRINNGGGYEDRHAGNGGTGTTSKGGDGGNVSGITGKIGLLEVNGMRAGSSDGTGGKGGNVSGINLKQIGSFAQLIAGGTGGDGKVLAGSGGSVSGITVPGDIGDFTHKFNLDPKATASFVNAGMGGLIAGLGGKKNGVADSALNGTIANITANRIAAILAGSVFTGPGITAAGALTKNNAVPNISGIHVTGPAPALGADTGLVDTGNEAGGGGVGTFTFHEGGANGGYQLSDDALNDGDTVIDGLVIVKTGHFLGVHPVPLKLIQV